MKRQYKQDIINIVNDERKRVVSERRALGYTQTDVARFSGCTSQNVSAFENGKNELNGLLANIQNTIQEL